MEITIQLQLNELRILLAFLNVFFSVPYLIKTNYIQKKKKKKTLIPETIVDEVVAKLS